jgi:hypothetical protein
MKARALLAFLLLASCRNSAAPAPATRGSFGNELTALGLRSGGVALYAVGPYGDVMESRCEPAPCKGSSKFEDWVGHAGRPPAGLGSKPAIASWDDGRIDIFVRGAADSALWHQTWDRSRWLGWENLGGALAFAPAAATWGEKRLDVFAVAAGARSSIWHLACVGLTAVPCRGGNWEPWAASAGSLPVAVVGDLAAAAPSNGKLDVYALGSDSAIWHQNWDGGRWVGWESLGGKMATPPTVIPRSFIYSSDTEGNVWSLPYGSRSWKKAGLSWLGPLASASTSDGYPLFSFSAGGGGVQQAICDGRGTCEAVSLD